MTEEEKRKAPSEKTVLRVVSGYLRGVRSVRRTPEGVSTYVYRIETEEGVRYARFLPEDATFGVEVLVQRLLTERGVPVPRVLTYVPREPVTGHSLMLAAELPGKSLAESSPANRAEILREAGRTLAELHRIPVEGFGWIDRESEETLRGEHPTYREYFTAFWEKSLAALPACGFSAKEREILQALLEEALARLDVPRAVLVHGDLCTDHIFQENGRFSGFIDFGEIRGNHPFFDLGDFYQSDESPGKEDTEALLAGYGQICPLSPDDRRAVLLAAFGFVMDFLGRKVTTPAKDLWLGRLRELVEKLT